MFDDIKDLIDQAAPAPDHAHRDELWQQFQDASAVGVARPTVLRPPASPPVPAPSDTIILEKVTLVDELARRRRNRRRYGLLTTAAALVSVAGIAVVNRGSKTLQVSPAGPSSTVAAVIPTSTAPTALTSTAAPTTAVTVATTTATTTAPPKAVSATTAAPTTTVPVTTVPKPVATAALPVTKLVTVLAPDYVETMTAIGGWDGKAFVTLPTNVAPGPYRTLDGQQFDGEIAKPDAEGHVHVTPPQSDRPRGSLFSLSATSWPAQPRAPRSQGDAEALKDARFDIYRQEASRLAKELGAGNFMPVLSSVVRVDLDGDGTDEVLVAASYIHYDHELRGPEPATVGSFSIAYVRHVVGDAASSKVLSAVVAKDSPRIVPDLMIDGVADLNGDGVMEVLGYGVLWESATFYCWDAGTADRNPKVLFSIT